MPGSEDVMGNSRAGTTGGGRGSVSACSAPLQDREATDAEQDVPLTLYPKAADYGSWTVEERSAHLADMVNVTDVP
jgi:hypothetical protein